MPANPHEGPSGAAAPPHTPGEADLDAVVCRVDVPAEEMFAILREPPGTGPVPDALRTWVHEHAHLYQALTTPVGVLMARLRTLQSDIVDDLLIRLPREFSLPARLPLLRYVSTLAEPARTALLPLVDLWYAAELLRAFHLGTVEGTAAGSSSPLGPHDLVSAFRLTQAGLENIAESRAAALAELGEPRRGGVRVSPERLADEAVAEPGLWLQLGLNVAAGGVIGLELGLPMVEESAAYAAELSVLPAESAEAGLRAADAAVLPHVFAYGRPLHDTRGCLGDADVRTVCRTHLAVCDLALFAPTLPEHIGLRRHGLRPDELLAQERLWRIRGVLPTVGPLHDWADYDAFTQRLCAMLDWEPPSTFTDRSLPLRPVAPVNTRDLLYETALECRARQPWTFADPTAGLPWAPAADPRRAAVEFAVVQFADSVALSGAAYTPSLLLEHLWHLWHRRMATGRPSPVPVPWRSTPEKLADWAPRLQEMLSARIGRPAPAPDLVSVEDG